MVAAALLATSFGTANAATLDKAGKYEAGKSYVLGWLGGDSAIAVTGTRADGFTLKSVKTSSLSTLSTNHNLVLIIRMCQCASKTLPGYKLKFRYNVN